jgi:hypothetical protein
MNLAKATQKRFFLKPSPAWRFLMILPHHNQPAWHHLAQTRESDPACQVSKIPPRIEPVGDNFIEHVACVL